MFTNTDSVSTLKMELLAMIYLNAKWMFLQISEQLQLNLLNQSLNTGSHNSSNKASEEKWAFNQSYFEPYTKMKWIPYLLL